jgi:aminoglycoside phosphotransferase family enzyme
LSPNLSKKGGQEVEIAAWLATQSERSIDTACARVFLAGEVAWKLKRNVDLGYVKWALDRELDFNRTAAPDIYRSVRSITREADGSLAWDGAGKALEYALEMRRFDDAAVLSADPSVIDGEMADALGRTIAGFHAAAAMRPGGGLSALEWTIKSNANLIAEHAASLGGDAVAELVERPSPSLSASGRCSRRARPVALPGAATATCTWPTS